MLKIVSLVLTTTFLAFAVLNAQVAYTAKDSVQAYDGNFRPGSNLGYFPPWTDFELANVAAGNPELGITGVGVKSIRPGLFGSFVDEWGYSFRVPAFEHYDKLGLKDNTLIVGFPSEAQRDQTYYCANEQSELFANLYEPIWLETASGRQINPENYYAAYLYQLVEIYNPYIKFWEIWNEPGLDFTGAKGWLPPGAEGNWWDNNPDPCDYKLRAPIQHYVRILRISYEVIKSLDESAYVCVSGTGYASFLDAILRNTDNPEGGTVTPEYPHGGGAYFDVMGFHSYPHFDGATRRWQNGGFVYFRHSDAAAAGIARTKGIYQEVLNKYGFDGQTYPAKEWIITEINVPRRSFSEFLGSEDAQLNFMMKAYFECVRQDILQMHVYSLSEQKKESEATFEFDLMGLYEKINESAPYKQTPTKAGIAYKTLSDALFDRTFDPAKTAELQLPPEVDGGAFIDKDGFCTYLLWAKTQIDQSEQANFTYSFPNELGITELSKKEWNYSETKAAKLVSSESIPLTATPILLRELAFTYEKPECAPTAILFEANPIEGGEIWSWQLEKSGEQKNYGGQSIVIDFETRGNYEVNLIVYDSIGNVLLNQSDAITIEGLPEPIFDIQAAGPLLYINNNSSENTASFQWDFGDGNGSTVEMPNYVYQTAGNYTIQLSVENACGSQTDTQEVEIKLAAPNRLPYTANEVVPAYDGFFRPGANLGYFPPWSDEQLATIAAGDLTNDIKGAGVKAIRPALYGSFVEEWGYDFRSETYDYYENLGLEDNTLIVGFPSGDQQDPNFYCPTIQSEHFANLYMDIWDDGTDGTPINDENHYAKYLYELVTRYGDHIKFWEIWNEPGLDFTGQRGWLPPGRPGNWWENDPDPCEYKLRAPIQHYVRVLRMSYEIIKTLDEDAFVVLSGTGYLSFLDALLRNTDNPVDGTVTPDYPHGAGAYFDVMGFHSYPHFDGTTKFYSVQEGGFAYKRHSDAAAGGLMRVRNNMQGVLDKYGYDGLTYPEKLWIITECNVPRRNFNDFIGGDEAQRNFMIKAFIEASINNFVQLHIYTLAEQTYLEDASYEFHLMGLYNRISGTKPFTETKTPAGVAYKTTSDLLFATKYDAERTAAMNLPTGVKGAAFIDVNGEYIYSLWAETAIDDSEEASATYSFPESWEVLAVQKKEWDYSETQQITDISAKDIALTASPIFVTEGAKLTSFPVAGFRANQTSGCTPLQVQFEDLSKHATQWNWHFEGGTPLQSSEQNPLVTYEKGGVYDVTLEVVNELGQHTYKFEQFVEATGSPTIDFEYEINGSIVDFKLLSDAPASTKYTWDFGNGLSFNAINPSQQYTESGSYEVSLITSGICASDTIVKTIEIAIPPTAMFQFNTEENCRRKVASFVNLSNSADSIEWLLPGGSPSYSTANNVIVLYRTPGVYEAKLIAWNEYGQDTVTQLVEVNTSPTYDLEQTICKSEELVVNGSVYGVNRPKGREIISRPDQCDSIVNISLSFVDQYITRYDSTLCAGESVEINGVLYDEFNPSGIEMLQSQNGCDSILLIDFEFLPAYDAKDTIRLCAEESYSLEELVVNQSGTYVQHFTTSAGCDSLVSLTLEIAEPIEIIKTTILSDSGNESGSASLEITGGFPPYQIEWDNGASGSTVHNLGMGRYKVSVTDANDCSATFDVVVPPKNVEVKVAIYPNPVEAGEEITIAVQSGIAQRLFVDLHTFTGQRLGTREFMIFEGSTELIYPAPINSGTYFVQLRTDSGFAQNFTLIVFPNSKISSIEEQH